MLDGQKNMINNKKTVFVGLSGGVDSSVSALLLKQQGYNVVGVFIRTWTPEFIECTWQSERRVAMRICAYLDIPFLECDAEKEYKEEVANYMIEEYKKGNTPNPDVMCNRQIKFGIFWNFAKKHGASYIATGHYVKNYYQKINSIYKLKKGNDDSKDQVYFLWTLTQDDLRHILFPVGELKKEKVREIALKHKLPNALKKDSQGVCFLGEINMKEFLKHYININKGDVLNEKGEIIGIHDGSVFFTIGERHGFSIFKEKSSKNKPMYVIHKDIKNNTITVSDQFNIKSNYFKTKVSCINTNWIIIKPEYDKKYQAQIRYHGKFYDCVISNINNKEVDIFFDESVLVDKGQSIVIYDIDTCLGGGIVK